MCVVWCVCVCVWSAFQQSSAASKSTVATDTEWSNTEVQLLIKAVGVYPAGTQKRWVPPLQATHNPFPPGLLRWEVITIFINDHAPDGCTTKIEKQVIAKVKSEEYEAGD